MGHQGEPYPRRVWGSALPAIFKLSHYQKYALGAFNKDEQPEWTHRNRPLWKAGYRSSTGQKLR